MISKILVPHDGTEMSDKAFEKAVELAKGFKAELVLLHVIEHVLEIPLSVHLIFDDIDAINKARNTARKELEKGWDKIVEVKTREIKDDNVDLTSECKYGTVGRRDTAHRQKQHNRYDSNGKSQTERCLKDKGSW